MDRGRELPEGQPTGLSVVLKLLLQLLDSALRLGYSSAGGTEMGGVTASMGGVVAEAPGRAIMPPGSCWTLPALGSAGAAGAAGLVMRASRSLRTGSRRVFGTSKVILARAFSLVSFSVRALRRSVKAVSLVLASSGFSPSAFLRSLGSSAVTATVRR